MVPQVATVEELTRIHSYVQRIHKVVELTHGINVKFKFGSHAGSGARLPARRAHGARSPSSSRSAPTT